jgi:hypothetical protein
MAEPDRPPGQRSLFDLGVTRVKKGPPPEVDRAEVEREMEAKRQARMQRVADVKWLAWQFEGLTGHRLL